MRSHRFFRSSLVVACVFVAVVLVAPFVVVFPLGFSEARSFHFPPAEYSLKWYEEFWSSPEWASRVRNSLLIATLSTVVSVVAGTMAALGVRKLTPKRQIMAIAMIIAPIVVPTVLIAFANYSVFLELNMVGTYQGFVLSHSMMALPMVFIPVWASLQGFDSTVERASASLGANRTRTFMKVTLPLIAPGVIAGSVFAFITSWDEVVVASFISSPSLQTLPVRLFIRISESTDPTVAAIASMLVVAILIGVVAVVAGQRARTRVSA
ncbi:ABC transporter permease subunit [Aeromicrobium sp. 636]|uniref:ABC transporter permease n=1 Tax=Aeromicrobium senzhongii TaxID=2663859 RepID=A0A8I0EU23_9ACTN|nr:MULTISPECIES: ABC transporter permease [Aeromicrobium]MBC9225122.1 ABC transporter permease [Aeromicrobium senzhongii]MCQ3997232.1 ABC transporter permease subunit [Aeromicrobium sp. 636]